jgi:hypothetical protein
MPACIIASPMCRHSTHNGIIEVMDGSPDKRAHDPALCGAHPKKRRKRRGGVSVTHNEPATMTGWVSVTYGPDGAA